MRPLLTTTAVALAAGLILAGCGKPQAPPDPQGAEPASNIAEATAVAPNNETAPAEPEGNTTGVVDGQTLDQMLAKTMNRFAELDLNGDGKLTQDELDAATNGGDREANVQRPHTGFSARAFEKADANGDGVVTRQEAEKQTRDRFKRLDTNADGAVSRDELAAGREHAQGQ